MATNETNAKRPVTLNITIPANGSAASLWTLAEASPDFVAAWPSIADDPDQLAGFQSVTDLSIEALTTAGANRDAFLWGGTSAADDQQHANAVAGAEKSFLCTDPTQVMVESTTGATVAAILVLRLN